MHALAQTARDLSPATGNARGPRAVLAALRKAEDDLMPEADQPRKIEVGMRVQSRRRWRSKWRPNRRMQLNGHRNRRSVFRFKCCRFASAPGGGLFALPSRRQAFVPGSAWPIAGYCSQIVAFLAKIGPRPLNSGHRPEAKRNPVSFS
jgi:hypothetical protein